MSTFALDELQFLFFFPSFVANLARTRGKREAREKVQPLLFPFSFLFSLSPALALSFAPPTSTHPHDLDPHDLDPHDLDPHDLDPPPSSSLLLTPPPHSSSSLLVLLTPLPQNITITVHHHHQATAPKRGRSFASLAAAAAGAFLALAPTSSLALAPPQNPAAVASGLAASASSGARIAPLSSQVSVPLYPPYALYAFCSKNNQYVPGTNELWFWENCPGMVSLSDEQGRKNVPACAPEQATIKLWETGAGKGQSSVLLSFATCAGGAEGNPATWFGWQPDPLGATPLPTTSAVTEVAVGVAPGAYTHGGCSSTAVTSYSENWTPSAGSGPQGGGSYTSPILHHCLLKNLTAGVKCVFFFSFFFSRF